MKLLPARAAHLRSDLPPAALEEVLRRLVGTGPDAVFSGRVEEGGFLVTGVRGRPAEHLPVIRARLAPDGAGTSVRLRLRAHAAVLLMMAMWLLFLGAAAAIVVCAHARDPAGRSLWLLLLPAGLAAFSWHLMAGVFEADARRALEGLCAKAPLRP
jgi:hypothetical protein